MEKIEFYQRSAVIEIYRKYFIDIFSILNVIKYFGLVDIFSNFSNVCHKIF